MAAAIQCGTVSSTRSPRETEAAPDTGTWKPARKTHRRKDEDGPATRRGHLQDIAREPQRPAGNSSILHACSTMIGPAAGPRDIDSSYSPMRKSYAGMM